MKVLIREQTDQRLKLNVNFQNILLQHILNMPILSCWAENVFCSTGGDHIRLDNLYIMICLRGD